jgi:hypothetical protein
MFDSPLTDTPPAVQQAVIEGMRAMSPADKLRAVGEANRVIRSGIVSELRRARPQASEWELRRALGVRLYGIDIGPAPARGGKGGS